MKAVGLALCLPLGLNAQLTVDNTMTPAQLVQNVLLGGGVQVNNITFNGLPANTVNEQAGTFNGENSNVGLNYGVILATGSIQVALGPNNSGSATQGGGNWGFGDPDLAVLAGVTTHDAAILEFDFIPSGDSISFRYVFSSEEYNEYVCATVNDVFGFFLSGPGITGPYTNNATNLALVPGTSIPISINTVNNGTVGQNGSFNNCFNLDPNWQQNNIYYIDNAGSQTIQFDGQTVVLTAYAQVICGEQYHIKMAIADGGDTAFDSAVFLEAGSFVSTGQVVPFLTEGANVVDDTLIYAGCGPVELNFQRLGDSTNVDTIYLSVGGTAIPGFHYSPAFPSMIIYQPGDTLFSFTFNAPAVEPGVYTIEIEIEQLIQCAGIGVTSSFTFYITLPPPLQLDVGANNIDAICGDVLTLEPVVTGGAGFYEYLWSTGETTPSITVSPGVTTTYYFMVTDTCGVEPANDSITVTLPIYPELIIEASPDILIDCLGTEDLSVSAEGGDGNFTYEWTLDGQVLGTDATLTVPAGPPQYYQVLVMEGCGTSAVDSVLVGTVPLEDIAFTTSGPQTAICPGYMVTLSIDNVTGGNGVYTYTWTNAQGAIVSATTSVDVEVPADEAYTISVADQCGYVTDSVVVAILPNITPLVVTLTPNQTICAGESIDLQVGVTGGSGYYFIDWVEEGHSDPILPVTPWERTTYTVGIYDECGQEVTRTVIIDVEYFTVEIVVNQPGLDDIYLLAASEPPAEIFLWDLGDGTRVRGQQVRHSYLNLDEHWVLLEGTSPNGCPAVDSVLIRPPGQLWFPNAFTPDGDGVNDIWGPEGIYIENFEMTIFDRWGQEVFRTNDMNVRWDGSVNGTPVMKTDVYVYKYRASGHLFPYKEGYGHVTLLRGTAEK